MSPKTKALQITSEVLALVSEIDEFKGAWRALGTLAPERLSALRRVATIESIGSSTRIEGSKLTDGEVECLPSNLEIKSFGSRDEQQVAGYAQVMETLFAHCDAIDLTENHITQLHRDLLAFSDKDKRHRGAYKTLPNHVSAFDADGKEIGVIFETATPFDTPRRMKELVEWTRTVLNEQSLHPLNFAGGECGHGLGSSVYAALIARTLIASPGTDPTGCASVRRKLPQRGECGAVQFIPLQPAARYPKPP